MCACVCVYLIVKDDHDKHAEQHRLHQEDDVVSAERERESHGKQVDESLTRQKKQPNGLLITWQQIHFTEDSHYQVLAGRLLSFFVCVAFSLIPYPPHPGRHHQH